MPHWISVLFASIRCLVLGYENAKHSYVYKTIAKKTCAPKTRATLAMPNIFFRCRRLSFVVCLCVNIFVPRLILNLNMFYKSVKCIRIDFQKSRKIFPSWVAVPLKMVNMAFCLFLRPQEICQMLQGGYACTKIFYSWNSVTLDFEGHICKIIHFQDIYGALQH